ncbi:hypothetical protein [Alkalihalobacillus sp. TS-13]|uniref:hypothetical protein n=1 Tax=Alkalihalobacillus sp. TS-13 TaxID=2842455 RepID=UPI001C883978|nr:hypothetical protein [Alkalihalobacillus sp. TS-13]
MSVGLCGGQAINFERFKEFLSVGFIVQLEALSALMIVEKNIPLSEIHDTPAGTASKRF